MEKTNNITEILEAFKIFDGNYKREQVDAAIELKEEITPFLIEILEKVLADPDTYLENDDRYDHIYSFMLLGHFKETKAHNVIVDLFSLPNKIPHELFGDLSTSDLPVVLLRTCGGSIDRIKSMASNKDVDDYCRISALNAMAFAVVEGIASREEVISFLGTLFTGNETDEDSDFWGLLAGLAYDLYPDELMDTIKKAYNDNLIASGMIRYEDFEQALEDGKERCLERLRTDLERQSLDNIHDSMSWWACFNEEPQIYSAQDPDDLINYSPLTASNQSTHKTNKKKKKAKKKKRKQAKASKRKNRR
jgi:hypothetical protein